MAKSAYAACAIQHESAFTDEKYRYVAVQQFKNATLLSNMMPIAPACAQ
jgi:hypothetical protein